MVYRGRVLEIEKKYAIVITDSFEYIRIVYKRNLEIGKEIIFLKEDIYKDKKFDTKKLAISAAVVLIMILSISLFGQLNMFNNISNAAAAIISIDINPSIEFEINEEYEVIRIVPINNEGKNLVDKKMIGMDVREVLLKVVESAFQKKYITDNKNTILISTLIINDDLQIQSDKLEQEINSIITQKINIAFISSNEENLKMARKENISIGKYEVYKESKIENNETTIEQVRNMEVSKIIDKGMKEIRIRKQNMNQNKNQNNVEVMNENIEDEKINKNKFRNSNKKNKEDKKMNMNGKKQKNGFENNDMEKPVQLDNNFNEKIDENISTETIDEETIENIYNEDINNETIDEETIENIYDENNDSLNSDLEDCEESEKRKRKGGNQDSKGKKEPRGS